MTLLIIGLLTEVARQLMQAKQFGLEKVVFVLWMFLEAAGHPVEGTFAKENGDLKKREN